MSEHLTGPWGRTRCHVAPFIPWKRPDETFKEENDPRSGMFDFVSKYPIRAGSRLCEHVMGGTVALDREGFARVHSCITVDVRFGMAMQTQGTCAFDENGMMVISMPYSNPVVQWATWYGSTIAIEN